MNQLSQQTTGVGFRILPPYLAPNRAPNWAPYFALPLVLLSLSSCTALNSGQRNTLEDLQTQVATVEATAAETRSSVVDLQAERDIQTDSINTQLDAIDKRLAKLPTVIKNICPEAPVDANKCPESGTQVVIKNSGKMVVGELERVWIDQPGVEIVARIDTGASSSSVHAANLEEFERDGEEWVRFEWQLKERIITTERPVVRYVRVIQQADPKGTRRPVVNMFVQMGDVEDNFDFTLADRAHLEYQIILGRNFLTDVALVDVGQKFVQPARKREAKASNKVQPKL